MDTQKKMRELVSALVDGEISDADLELAFASLMSPEGQEAWATYYRIADTLRHPGAPSLSDDFAARLAARLDAEPPPTALPATEDANPNPPAPLPAS